MGSRCTMMQFPFVKLPALRVLSLDGMGFGSPSASAGHPISELWAGEKSWGPQVSEGGQWEEVPGKG